MPPRDLNSMTFVTVGAVALFIALVVYLAHIQCGYDSTHEDAQETCGTPWTLDKIREAYRRCLDKPTSFRHQLPQKTGRRYIAVGGSGVCAPY